MEDAWKTLSELFEDGVPCLVLFKDDSKNQWSLCSWIPEDTPVKPKMLASSTQKTVKDAFNAELGPWAKNFAMTEKVEATFAAYQEATKEQTEEERKACMTTAELIQEEARLASEQERKEQEGKKIGMVGLGAASCNAHESFDAAVKAVGGGKAMLAKITGDKGKHQVEGDVLEGINKPSDLADKLDDEVPGYVLMQGEDGLVFMSWIPDNAPVKPRMNVSSYKRDVCDKIKKLAGGDLLLQEVSLKSELTEALLKKAVESAAPQAKPKPKAGPMAGAFKLPGLP